MEKSRAIGAILKEQREMNEISLDTICRKTYIRQSYLEAIENGDYQVIGDMVYVKGFIRNYAQAIGMDGNEAVRHFEGEMDAVSGISVMTGDVTGNRNAKGRKAFSPRKGPRRRHADKKHFTKLEWAILMAGAILILLLWIWMLYL